MMKLRGTILTSGIIAFLSTFFLYVSYVQSVDAQEPVVGAASTEYVQEIIELIIFEQNLDLSKHETNKEENLSDDSETEIIIEDKSEIKDEVVKEKSFQATDREEQPIEIKVIEIEKTSPRLEPTEEEILRAIENKIHTLSNNARLKRAHTDLGLDERLSKLAQKRSEDMLEQNYFSHTSPDGCDIVCNFEESGYEALEWGENIARYEPFNQKTAQVVAEIFVEKWLKSSSHRDNLLSDQFAHQGIGAAVRDGEIIVTVIFAGSKK